jgi:glutathione synthase/RimK-type ligase-like ATP-grasp enzyme
MRVIAPDVLILTADDDETTDYLIPRLERERLRWIRWDPGYVPTRAAIGMEFSGRNWQHFEITTNPNTRIRLDDVGVIWFRRPSPGHAPTSCPTQDVEDFINTECGWFFRGLWANISAAWVNHPDRGQLASYKPSQLALASQLGFRVPRTYVGNSPERVQKLWDACDGQLIVKSFHQTFVGLNVDDKRALFASMVTADDIKEKEAISACPSIWQEYIPKNIEIRVTVVGHRVLSAEIHSQKSELTRHDWRNYDFANVPHYKHLLPDEIQQLCLTLVQKLGLYFGAIDLVLTPTGEYVFLEINPFGQWAWIEDLCGLPIAEAHCELFSNLIREATRR